MTNETENARYTRIFNEGYDACRKGKSNLDNPYASTDDGDAEAWNEGWLDRLDAENDMAEGGCGW
jgi:hypothetical protein